MWSSSSQVVVVVAWEKKGACSPPSAPHHLSYTHRNRLSRLLVFAVEDVSKRLRLVQHDFHTRILENLLMAGMLCSRPFISTREKGGHLKKTQMMVLRAKEVKSLSPLSQFVLRKAFECIWCFGSFLLRESFLPLLVLCVSLLLLKALSICNECE